ncbi:MAG: hypothetical protein IVW57_08015 [Ktedonobacterales bacterium]|nr:hypothetical protein [Ktedonobacterales bacterium]
MRNDPRIAAYVATWGALDCQPWRVRLRTATAVGGYGALHVDGILSYGLVRCALRGAPLAESAEPYDLPLPLRCLWRDPATGLPLWAATDLAPVGLTQTGRQTWTRKQIAPQLLTTSSGKPYAPRSSAGPYKDMQIPLPVRVAEGFMADIWGDARIISDLLQPLLTVGKKGAQGLGQIIAWDLEPLATFHLVDDAGCARRPIPVAALASWDLHAAQMGGWTPPYWRNHTPIAPVGTRVTWPEECAA